MAASRLASGHRPLDEILGGGLPANGISLIMGQPGAGKTILAQQYAFQNATAQRPVVYFSTLSEPLEKIVRFGQTLDFFDPAAVGTSVYYEDLGQAAAQDGLGAVTEQITATLKDRRPGLVVIDGSRRCGCSPTTTRPTAGSCTSSRDGSPLSRPRPCG